jgi:hypothetical protein
LSRNSTPTTTKNAFRPRKLEVMPKPSSKLIHFKSIATVTLAGEINGVSKVNQDTYSNFSLSFRDQEHHQASCLTVFDGHGQNGHSVSKFLANEVQGKLLTPFFVLKKFIFFKIFWLNKSMSR